MHVFGLILMLFVLVTPANVSAEDVALNNKPRIYDFRFIPDTVRYGDQLRYIFTYYNFPGGLATVKDIEMWVWWQRPNERQMRSRFVPSSDELGKYTTESGTFESRLLKWRPPEYQAPSGKIDVMYTLRLKLMTGEIVSTTAKIRFVE